MEDISASIMGRHCCACLSRDRRLSQLCRVAGGINSLYSLLSFDSEAFREGFYMDTANLFVCWECKSLLHRFTRFREQVCAAQRQLSILIQRQEEKPLNSLSKLAKATKTSFDHAIIINEVVMNELGPIEYNFIDCGPIDVKSEPESTDDNPLTQQNTTENTESDICVFKSLQLQYGDEVKKKSAKAKPSDKAKTKGPSSSKEQVQSSPDFNRYYTTTQLSEEEMWDRRFKMKSAISYIEANYKCETCIEGFKQEKSLNKHLTNFHTEKADHSACDVCQQWVPHALLALHRRAHAVRLECALCTFHAHAGADMSRHLETVHVPEMVTVVKKFAPRRAPVARPGSRPRRNAAMMDPPTALGYPCSDCDLFFEDKGKRWKHIQRTHREGFACSLCGKKFAFRSNLLRHESAHVTPRPRAPCPVCGKLIRTDLLKTHALIHTQRRAFSCEECQKTFASASSYDHHMKYTAAHTIKDLLKFYVKYGFPGVTGCIDCTHVAIVPPDSTVHDERSYVNRKNYHSINTQLICDANLKILNVNSLFPGSTHVAHIWNSSNVLSLFESLDVQGITNYHLIGDSGYALRPWCLTPIAQPEEETPEFRYNEALLKARCTIEQCNGVLKSRFRCLLKDRTLHYAPVKASKIVIACTVLHNMCIMSNVGEPDIIFDVQQLGILEHAVLPADNNDRRRQNLLLQRGRAKQATIIRNYFN